MIFVTVGTHEQQFNRLIQYIDELKEQGKIEDEIIMQTGYCTYEPKACKWENILPYSEMVKNVAEARLIITHGGPSSFIMPLQIGKIPIVVPRRKEFDEHVNNHQLEFAKQVAERQGNIIVVEDMNILGDIITNYEEYVRMMPSELKSNNAKFVKEFKCIVKELLVE